MKHPPTLLQRTIRIGSVSFLNAKPLLWQLEHDPTVEIGLDVPSRLLEGLRRQQFDVALLPIIDYQRMAGLRIVPSGAIGSADVTLTVRLFSQVPIEQIELLGCDTDSHTSVALARVILAEHFGRRPEFASLDSPAGQRAHARLLIGDKVVCAAPDGFPHQLDLGAAWRQMTGLPFVFAAWMAREGVELDDLPERLEKSKCEGLRHIDEIIEIHGVTRGWPRDIARTYLLQNLQYDIGPRQLEAIRLYHRLAARHGMIDAPVRDLVLV